MKRTDLKKKKTRYFISGHRMAVKTEMIAIILPHKNTDTKKNTISVRKEYSVRNYLKGCA